MFLELLPLNMLHLLYGRLSVVSFMYFFFIIFVLVMEAGSFVIPCVPPLALFVIPCVPALVATLGSQLTAPPPSCSYPVCHIAMLMED